MKVLKAEVSKLKQENKDFAAELDKTQSLLNLQTDIEKENRQYFEVEKQRLDLLARSTSLKVDEMRKKVDSQVNIIKEMERSLGITRLEPGQLSGSPAAPGMP